MIWRKVSYIIMKWLTLLLCLFTVLLTTPLGSRLTVSLLNNIDGIDIDYKAGSLVRDIQLNSFHLKLETLDIGIKDLVTEIDFSCSWTKKLCLDALKVESFSLAYTKENDTKNDTEKDTKTENEDNTFVMPFSIDAQNLEFTHIHIVINQTVIDIEQFTSVLSIKGSQFNILTPLANELIVTQRIKENSEVLPKKEMNDIASSIHTTFSTLPKIQLPITLNIQELFVEKVVIINQEVNSKNTDKEPQNQLTKDTSNTSINKHEIFRSLQSHLSATWDKSDVKVSNFQTSTTDYSINNFKADVQLIPPYKINASLTTKINKMPMWPELTETKQNISFKGALDDLTINLQSEGNVELSSEGHINLTHVNLPFKLKLAADKLPLPLSLAQYGQPSTLSLSLAGDLVEQTVNLNSELNSYGYENALISLAASHRQGLISLSDVTFNDKASDSQLRLKGDIDIQSEETKWHLVANSTGFTLPKININSLLLPEKSTAKAKVPSAAIEKESDDEINGHISGKIASTGTWSNSHWSLSLNDTDIYGVINTLPLKIKGDIALNHLGYLSSGDLPDGEILIALDKNKLTLKTINDSKNDWHVNGQLSITDINHWYKDASGSIATDFTIKGENENPIITLNSEINQLNWQQFHSSSLKIIASYQPFNNHKAQLTIKNKQLELTNKEISIQDILINISGDLSQQKLHADWHGDFGGEVELAGQWHNTLNQWQGLVEKTVLSYQERTWLNDKSYYLEFDVNKKTLSIDKHCWQGKGIDICLPNNATVGQSGDLSLALNIDLSLMNDLFLPEEMQLTSKISGEIKAKWSPTQAIFANANFDLSSGSIKVTDDYSEQLITQWHQGLLSFKVNEKQFTSQFQLQDIQEKALLSLTSKVMLSDDLPIESKIEINQFNIQPFQSMIGSIVNLQGKLTAKLAINGTVNTPITNGFMALNSGELLLRDTPNKFEKIKTEITIKNNKANLVGEFFIEENRAELTGDFSWQDSLLMNIDLNAKKLSLVSPPQLMMNISPTLNFSLREKLLTISGNIDVIDGSYNIEKLPQGSISLSDDVIVVDQHGKEVFKASSGVDIKTDVSVNIAKAFEISGQGLQSQLFGQLQVSQKQKQPLQIFGNIQSENGTFKAYGQELNIEKGKITFNGPLDNPYLNFQASRHIKADEVDVGLQITGLADSLDIKLFSTPTMETSDMLSYLVRGRGIDAGGGNSTAAVSMLVGFGVTNSTGLFQKLEKLPLISNIAIDTQGEGDKTQAVISGYIADRIYLQYGVGVYEPVNELTVRWYLLNRLWLEVVSGLEQSSDIYYSFDID